jgi:hypothetical protein
MLADAGPFLDARSRQATAEIARALAEKGIDWSADENPRATARPEPSVRVEWNPESRVLRAGIEEKLELRVINEAALLYRARGARPRDRLRGLGALIGRIEPGASITRSTRSSRLWSTRTATGEVVLKATQFVGTRSVLLVVDESPRLILAHRVSVTRGDTMDVLSFTWRYQTEDPRRRANPGSTPATGVGNAELRGTTTFPPIAPGATVDTHLHVKLLTSTAEAPTVNLIAFDTEYRSFVDSEIRLVEAEGRWLEPPRVVLSRFETRERKRHQRDRSSVVTTTPESRCGRP